jgi:hypothetical protein
MRTKKTGWKIRSASDADRKDDRRQPPAKSRPMTPAEMRDFEERVVRKNQPEPLPPKRLIPM